MSARALIANGAYANEQLSFRKRTRVSQDHLSQSNGSNTLDLLQENHECMYSSMFITLLTSFVLHDQHPHDGQWTYIILCHYSDRMKLRPCIQISYGLLRFRVVVWISHEHFLFWRTANFSFHTMYTPFPSTSNILLILSPLWCISTTQVPVSTTLDLSLVLHCLLSCP